MSASKIGILLWIAMMLSACGSGSNDGNAANSDNGGNTVFETGPNVSIGPLELSMTINNNGDVVLQGSVTPTLIGIKNLGSIGWEFGFETTLYDAQSQSNLLLILYQNEDGEIMQHVYDIREPFDIRFAETDWVRRMKREDNGSIVVFVDRHVDLQANDDIAQPVVVHSSASEFIRDYYATISNGDYQSGWDMLTDNFKTNYNSSGYGPYVDWWNTVDRIDVLSINVTSQDSSYASMYVELSYYYNNGNVDTYDLMSVTLIHSSTTNNWMIDDAYLVSGTR